MTGCTDEFERAGETKATKEMKNRERERRKVSRGKKKERIGEGRKR
jgi:hypothetical protein